MSSIAAAEQIASSRRAPKTRAVATQMLDRIILPPRPG